MKETKYQNDIYKLLITCNKSKKPDEHSFTADVEKGNVFVDCRGYEIFIEQNYFDTNIKEKRVQWAGTLVVTAIRLENLKIDLLSIEI